MVSDYNFQKGSILFGYLDGKGGGYDSDGNIIVKGVTALANASNGEEKITNLIKVASADTSFWGMSKSSSGQDDDDEGTVKTISTGNTQKVDFSPMLVQESFLVSPSSFYDEASEEQRYGITKYTVENGDTVSSIATSFGVSTYTVLWANDLKTTSYIKPGQTLDILPVTGVKHVVTESDTIASIASKYNADAQEIIIFNELPADGTLTAGKILIVPNGEKEKPVEVVPVQPSGTTGSTVVSSTKYAYSSLNPLGGHTFPYGQCTWYVSTRTYVPWGGNAKAWLVNAAAYGYSTGRTPVPGAIVVTTEHRLYGHVAYVESVTATTITVSEMNYVGWARQSVRVIPRDSAVIRGYIYP